MAAFHEELHFQCIYSEYLSRLLPWNFLDFSFRIQKWCGNARMARPRRKALASECFTSAEMRVRNTEPKSFYNISPHHLQKEVQEILRWKELFFCCGGKPQTITCSILFYLKNFSGCPDRKASPREATTFRLESLTWRNTTKHSNASGHQMMNGHWGKYRLLARQAELSVEYTFKGNTNERLWRQKNSFMTFTDTYARSDDGDQG